jgi:hypothetical protein
VQQTPQPSPANANVQGQGDHTLVMLTNFSNETLIIPKSTVVGVAETVSESLVNKLNADMQNDTLKKNNNALFQKLLGNKLDHLTSPERELIGPVLRRYAHLFHDEESNEFEATNVVEHQIILTDETPIRRPQYRTPFALRDEMKSQVENMLAKGIIRPSMSPWSAPAILVPKRTLDAKPKYRFCVDFRALNAVTKFDCYTLPAFEESTATLRGSKYFTVLDCQSGFWQVPIREDHRERTGFPVPSGHHKFNRLPFGLTNSPANFQRMMDIVLKDLMREECLIYIDVVIFSRTAEEHAVRLENVLERCNKANLQLHKGKCAIAQSQVNYLGYILSQDGVSASADKVKAVKNYATPRNVRDVRAFIGLASFYRRLVPDFAKLAKPLTTLIRKNQEFLWVPNQQEAFDNLKNGLCTTPVLAFPDFSRPFILTSDARKIAVAAVLSQVQDGVERPIAYASRQLNRAEQNYSASEAELLAVVWAAKFFRCYLFGRHFVVRTDHAALTYLTKFSDQNARLARWALKLSELYFTIEHRAGSKIPHADALSRHVATIQSQETLDPETVLH